MLLDNNKKYIRLKVFMRPIFLFIVFLFILSCSLQKQLDKTFFLSIETSNDSFKLSKSAKLIILPFETNSFLFNDLSPKLFQETMDFHLKRKGLNVVALSKENAFESPSIENAEELDEVKSNTGSKIEMKDLKKFNKGDIKRVLKMHNVDYCLSGFVHEAEIGNILEEEYTSGIILSVSDKTGNEISRIMYQGRINLKSFSDNSFVAEKITNKLVEN